MKAINITSGCATLVLIFVVACAQLAKSCEQASQATCFKTCQGHVQETWHGVCRCRP